MQSLGAFAYAAMSVWTPCSCTSQRSRPSLIPWSDDVPQPSCQIPLLASVVFMALVAICVHLSLDLSLGCKAFTQRFLLSEGSHFCLVYPSA